MEPSAPMWGELNALSATSRPETELRSPKQGTPSELRRREKLNDRHSGQCLFRPAPPIIDFSIRRFPSRLGPPPSLSEEVPNTHSQCPHFPWQGNMKREKGAPEAKKVLHRQTESQSRACWWSTRHSVAVGGTTYWRWLCTDGQALSRMGRGDPRAL